MFRNRADPTGIYRDYKRIGGFYGGLSCFHFEKVPVGLQGALGSPGVADLPAKR